METQWEKVTWKHNGECDMETQWGMWHGNTKGFSSAVENKIVPFSGRCLQLEFIMLSKIN